MLQISKTPWSDVRLFLCCENRAIHKNSFVYYKRKLLYRVTVQRNFISSKRGIDGTLSHQRVPNFCFHRENIWDNSEKTFFDSIWFDFEVVASENSTFYWYQFTRQKSKFIHDTCLTAQAVASQNITNRIQLIARDFNSETIQNLSQ